MKHSILYVFLLLPVLASAQKSYLLSGEISGMKGKFKVYLATVKNGKYEDTDSAVVTDGKFQLKGSVASAQPALLKLVHERASSAPAQSDLLSFFLENSRITVNAKDSIRNSVIAGSAADRENRLLEGKVRPLTNAIIELNRQFYGKPKDEARQKASDSVTKLVAAIKDIKLKFVEQHLNEDIGMYIYNVYILDSKFDPAKVEPLYNRFSAQVKSTELGRRSLEKIDIARRRQTGIKSTDFTQTDLNGKEFTLSSLRGKYVLVDFWASWCVPCRAENPNLVKAYAQLKSKNFEVVGVSLDMGKPEWAAAVKKDNLPWIHVSDLKGWKNAVAAMYGINSVPQNLLINPDGIIIAKDLRGENLTEKLTALIK
jgi:thiol-disulfide isomerase/thioredoxin